MVVIVYTNVNLFNVTKLQHLTITKNNKFYGMCIAMIIKIETEKEAE